jgi:hypothetical protein
MQVHGLRRNADEHQLAVDIQQVEVGAQVVLGGHSVHDAI